MSYEDLKKWREKTKSLIASCLGGKCNRCGYDTTLKCLDFHHIDPSTKEHNLSALLMSPRKRSLIVEEAKKCVLLCRNCHGELHDGLWSLDDIVIVDFDEIKLPWYVLKIERYCLNCDKAFKPKRKRHIFCSLNCKARHENAKHITKRPDKTELQELLWKFPKITIAKMFNVSDKSVKNWADKYGLSSPPRGYWQKGKLTKI